MLDTLERDLTRLYFTSDPSNVGRYVESLQKGITAELTDEACGEIETAVWDVLREERAA